MGSEMCIRDSAMPGGLLLSRNRPSTPSDMKRSCQRQTQGLDFPVACMMATVPRPLPLIKMILARQTCFCGDVGAAMMASSRERSAAVTSNVIPVRIPNRRTIPNGWESQDGIFRRDQSTSENFPALSSVSRRDFAASPFIRSASQRGGLSSGVSISAMRIFWPSNQKVSPSTTQFARWLPSQIGKCGRQ